MVSGIMVKGGGFINTMKYLKKAYDKETIEQILSCMPDNAREVATSAMASSIFAANQLMISIYVHLAPLS